MFVENLSLKPVEFYLKGINKIPDKWWEVIQIMVIFFFSSYNVWKHVQYPILISRQPGW